MLRSLHEHAREPRIDRQPRHVAADRRQLVVDERPEFGQQIHCIAYRARLRRIEKRKRRNVAEAECTHLQHHGGEIRAANFGVGIGRLRQMIGFRVQAITDTGRHATAASFALVGARLGDALDRQPLQLRTIAVATHARISRIDDEADVRHRQRRFRDVGRKDDAAPTARRKNALLFRRGQARIQRQHVVSITQFATQQLRRFLNFAFTREEHQDVVGAVCRALLRCRGSRPRICWS